MSKKNPHRTDIDQTHRKALACLDAIVALLAWARSNQHHLDWLVPDPATPLENAISGCGPDPREVLEMVRRTEDGRAWERERREELTELVHAAHRALERARGCACDALTEVSQQPIRLAGISAATWTEWSAAFAKAVLVAVAEAAGVMDVEEEIDAVRDRWLVVRKALRKVELPDVNLVKAGLKIEHGKVRKPPQDGPEGGCWLWWQGRRRDIPKGVVYRLIAHMWSCDSATYETLDEAVFEDPIQPSSMRARVSEVNKVLAKVGVPWRLQADSISRTLTKQCLE